MVASKPMIPASFRSLTGEAGLIPVAPRRSNETGELASSHLSPKDRTDEPKDLLLGTRVVPVTRVAPVPRQVLVVAVSGFPLFSNVITSAGHEGGRPLVKWCPHGSFLSCPALGSVRPRE